MLFCRRNFSSSGFISARLFLGYVPEPQNSKTVPESEMVSFVVLELQKTGKKLTIFIVFVNFREFQSISSIISKLSIIIKLKITIAIRGLDLYSIFFQNCHFFQKKIKLKVNFQKHL